MEIHQRDHGVFVCQRKYLKQILKRFGMEECRSVSTPMNLKEKLQKGDGAEATDATAYRSLIGCLVYLTATRPAIMFAVSALSRFMNCASELHLVAAKRVVRYLKCTTTFGIKFTKGNQFKLGGFSDSDWAGYVDDMRSTSRYCFTLGSGCFSWSSKKQDVVAQSTAEVEFMVATAASNQAIWLRKLLMDLGFQQEELTQISVDNQDTLAIS
ncbi:hypothetical protein CRG98_038975 [Punica granatum]|uniref:Reverse transcriptase Ty1/copia-type domain-containing protein n=1 Tax=Punica granatum TaxID=22663 RepID=A0A2I0IB74_PUNGR|nr:hypothetical protein CRG98_038975 [Punica granatum]